MILEMFVPLDGLCYTNDYEEILNLFNKGFPSNNNAGTIWQTMGLWEKH